MIAVTSLPVLVSLLALADPAAPEAETPTIQRVAPSEPPPVDFHARAAFSSWARCWRSDAGW